MRGRGRTMKRATHKAIPHIQAICVAAIEWGAKRANANNQKTRAHSSHLTTRLSGALKLEVPWSVSLTGEFISDKLWFQVRMIAEACKSKQSLQGPRIIFD